MNALTDDFQTVEEGMAALKKAVSLRDQMGGALYYNILNEDCCAIANKLTRLGADRAEIRTILGEGTFQ